MKDGRNVMKTTTTMTPRTMHAEIRAAAYLAAAAVLDGREPPRATQLERDVAREAERAVREWQVARMRAGWLRARAR
jgi:hypothetical protein